MSQNLKAHRPGTRSLRASQGSQQQLRRQISELQACMEHNEISSIRSASWEYFGGQPPTSTQEMVLVPKSKLLELLQEVQMLKKALKSQHKHLADQIESLRHGVQAASRERVLQMRQQEYLRDMHRTRSEDKNIMYRSEGNFYPRSNKK